MGENLTKHVLEIPFEEYKNASHPELFYWLQVVPFDTIPRFDSFLEFLIKNFDFFQSKRYFYSDFFWPENITQPFHDHSINFNSWLAIHPSFPAAITFFEQSKKHTNLDHFKQIISFILCHFIGVQAQLRSEYLSDPSHRNFSNTLIQSSRIMRLHLIPALEEFAQELNKFSDQINISHDQVINLRTNDLLSQMNGANGTFLEQETVEHLKRFKGVIDTVNSDGGVSQCISFLDQLNSLLEYRYDLKPLIRLFEYYLEDKHLGQKRSSSRSATITLQSRANKSLNDSGALVLTPTHTEHIFTADQINIENEPYSTQDAIDMGEAPSEFENQPKVFSEDLLLKDNIQDLPIPPIEQSLSINTRLSPSKGAGYKAQLKSARNSVQHILKGKLKLLEAWDALSEPEWIQLLDVINKIYFAPSDEKEILIEEIQSYAPLDTPLGHDALFEAGAALAASLLLGCAIDDLYFISNTEDIVAKDLGSKKVFSLSDKRIHYDANVPTYKKPLADQESVEFYESGKRSFLTLPNFLKAAIEELVRYKTHSTKLRKLFSLQMVEYAQGLIKALNRQYSTRITLTRISRLLPYYLNHMQGDKALLGLLGLNPSDVYVQNYYSNYSIRRINAEYQEVIRLMLSKTNIGNERHRYSFFNIKCSQRVGSRNRVKNESVKELILGIEALIQASDSLPHHEYHNLMTSYLFFLMMFFCGARPSKNVLSNIDYIDHINNLIFISDKDSADNYSTRPVPAHKTLIKQIKAYQQHIQTYQDTHIGSNNSNFLYFLDARNNVQEFAIKTVFENLNLSTNLPKNFLRATFRHVMMNGIPKYRRDSDSMMSHWDAGEEFFTHYSGYDFNKIKTQHDIAWTRFYIDWYIPSIVMECRR